MDVPPAAQKPPLGPGAAFLIGLTALISSVGYLGFLTWIVGAAFTTGLSPPV